MTKDTASIREVYDLVSKMREEMQQMRKEMREDFKNSMDAHVEWAKETVAHYDIVVSDYDKRMNKAETFIDHSKGQLSIIAGIVGFLVTVAYNLGKDIFTSGK